MKVTGHLHDPTALCPGKKSGHQRLQSRVVAEGRTEDRLRVSNYECTIFPGFQSEQTTELFHSSLSVYINSESTGQVTEQRITASVSNSNIPDSD
jgi:hypothetical protein